MKKIVQNKGIVLALVIGFAAYFLFTLRLSEAYIFENDMARDMYDMLNIARGKLMLIGTKSSFGGIYQGPWYYYLFLPVFWLSNYDLNALLFFNSFLFACGLIYFFVRAKKYLGVKKAFLASCCIGLLPAYFLSARSPGNAYSYIPLLPILFSILYFEKFENNRWWLVAIGLCLGFCMNFHYANGLLALPILIYVWAFLKNKGNVVFVLLPLVLTFLPVIAFEIKHNFVMIKNTFIDKSYSAFVDNKNIPQEVKLKRGVFENTIVVAKEIVKSMGVWSILLIVSGVVTNWKNRVPKREWYLLIVVIVSFILLSTILRSQIAPHYFLPFSFSIFFISLMLTARSNFGWIIGFIALFEVLYLPYYVFENSFRPIHKYQKFVNHTIEDGIVKKGEKFNIIQARDRSLVNPLGYEYRFFFRKEGFEPVSEFNFDKSDSLLVFIEDKSLGLKDVDNWEMSQFGRQYIQNSQRSAYEGVTVYKLNR